MHEKNDKTVVSNKTEKNTGITVNEIIHYTWYFDTQTIRNDRHQESKIAKIRLRVDKENKDNQQKKSVLKPHCFLLQMCFNSFVPNFTVI